MTTTSVRVQHVAVGDLVHWGHDRLAVDLVRRHHDNVGVLGTVTRTGERHRLDYEADQYVTVTRPEG